ncbi:MAG: hypothetical protein GXO92_00160 [FCB group bacterium]|nr:hypothetical protein [FCB group bacterium]
MRYGFLLILCLCSLQGQSVLSGHLQNWTAWGINKESDYNLARDRLRLNYSHNYQRYRFYYSGELAYEVLGKASLTALNRELYLDVYGRSVDLRIGKQKVVWGLTEGLFLNDIINPRDNRYFLIQDLDDIRLGTFMVKLNWFVGNWNLESLWIPRFEPGVTPQDKNPWVEKRPEWYNFGFPVYYRFGKKNLPEMDLANSELGLRLKGRFNETDVWFYAFKGFQGEPVFTFVKTDWYPDSIPAGAAGSRAEVVVNTLYKPLTMIGIDLTRPVGLFVLKGEFGYFFDYAFNGRPILGSVIDDAPISINTRIYYTDYFQAMGGFDVNGPLGIGVTVQYIQKLLFDYREEMPVNRMEQWLSVSFSGLFLEGDGNTEVFVLHDLRNKAGMLKWENGFRFGAGFLVGFGLDWFWGKADNWIGQFDANDNIFVKLTYSF